MSGGGHVPARRVRRWLVGFTALAAGLLVAGCLTALWIQPWKATFWPWAVGLLCLGGVLVVAALPRPLVSLAALLFGMILIPRQVNIDVGLAVTIDRALLPFLLAGLAVTLWRRRRQLEVGGHDLRLGLAACAYLGWLLVLLPHSPRPLEAVFQPLYRAFLGPLVAWAAAAEVRRRSPGADRVDVVVYLTAALVAGVLLASLLGLIEVLLRGYLVADGILHWRGGWLRAVATLENPLVYAAVGAMVVPLCVGAAAAAWWGERRAGALTWTLAGLGSAAGSLLGMARSSLLGLCAGVTLTLVLLVWRPARAASFARLARSLLAAGLLIAGLAGLGAVAYTSLVAPATFLDRWAADNVSHRLAMAGLSVRLVAEHPLVGVGLMGFGDAGREVAFVNWVDSPFFGQFLTAHNSYLQVAVEAGLPALLGLLYLTAGAFVLPLRWALTAPVESSAAGERAILAGLLGSLTVALVAAQVFDLFGWLVPWTITCCLAGLALGLTRDGHG